MSVASSPPHTPPPSLKEILSLDFQFLPQPRPTTALLPLSQAYSHPPRGVENQRMMAERHQTRNKKVKAGWVEKSWDSKIPVWEAVFLEVGSQGFYYRCKGQNETKQSEDFKKLWGKKDIGTLVPHTTVESRYNCFVKLVVSTRAELSYSVIDLLSFLF